MNRQLFYTSIVTTVLLFGGLAIPAAHAQYVANAQSFTTSKNTTLVGYTTGSAPQEFYYQVTAAPLHGYLELDGATGQFTYTPNNGYVGTDAFSFRTVAIANSHWFGQSAVVSINVVQQVNTNGGWLAMAFRLGYAINAMSNVVPESHDQTINQAIDSDLLGVLHVSQFGADISGLGWNNLSEGQQVWILEHFSELVA